MTMTTLLPKTSRIWIYQTNRPLTDQETKEMSQKVDVFTEQWTSHSQQLKAHGNIYHNRFIVFGVDQSVAGASGCSIDGSVRFIQQLEQDYHLDLFDRMSFAYEYKGEIKTAHKEEFQDLYKKGIITEDTMVFNNLITTLEEFETSWRVRLGDSWHMNLID